MDPKRRSDSVPGGRRMMRNESVHKTRSLLNEYIIENPGVTIKIIAQALKVTTGTLRYHLDYLIKEEKVISKREFGRKRYFPYLTPPQNRLPNSRDSRITRNHSRVLSLIDSNPGINRSDLKEKLNITSKGLSYILERMKECYLIKEEKTSSRSCYFRLSKDELYREAILVLSKKLVDGDIDERTFIALRKDIKEKLG